MNFLLRGAQVRDAHAWAGYLTESIGLYAGAADMAFASHHWPTWGNDGIVALLTRQRDLYAYLHDQTVRLINKGLNGTEIAESLRLPPQLERVWANRGYYGSLSHKVKAVYQRYMGWFDANPAHPWEHPPAEEARRWVESLGGQAAVRARARHYSGRGDLRFAVTLLNHAVFNDPGRHQGEAATRHALRPPGPGRRERRVAQFLPHRCARTLAGDQARPQAHHGTRGRCVSPSTGTSGMSTGTYGSPTVCSPGPATRAPPPTVR
jgi:alkyl sulfatase BDS1-like metallo-beta-lactamase superfamily hydrolase